MLKTESLAKLKKLPGAVTNDEFLFSYPQSTFLCGGCKTDGIHESLTSSDIKSKMKMEIPDELINEFSIFFEEIEMQIQRHESDIR